MPRLDGTGPNGEGAKTGRGLGNCDGATSNDQTDRGRGGRGRGRGRGRGFMRLMDLPKNEEKPAENEKKAAE